MGEAERVVLMYHELERPGLPLCQSEPGYVRYVVRESDFRAQVNFLKESGWSGLSVTEAFSEPQRSGIVITFDDGCETDLLTAAPILKDAAFGATFYITVGFVGQRGYLTAKQVQEVSGAGFEIGCHSLTHAYLPDLDDSGLEKEISLAKNQLEQMTGRTVRHFSCPGGRWSARVVETARRAGYQTLATSRPRANAMAGNHYSLGRIAVMRETPLPVFAKICRGDGLWRLALRNRLRDLVKASLGNNAYDRARSALLQAKGRH